MALSAERKAQLQKLKDDAAELGVKVRTNIMDDLGENLAILVVGIFVGVCIGKFLL